MIEGIHIEELAGRIADALLGWIGEREGEKLIEARDEMVAVISDALDEALPLEASKE
jgi:hypothetical protein